MAPPLIELAAPLLEHTILCTTGASSSQKRFNTLAGMPSEPVAFLGFRCLRTDFTCPMGGVGGGFSLRRVATSSRSGTTVEERSRHGLVKETYVS